MIPRRALVIEGLTALPFSINIDDRMGTGDTSLSSHCPITAPGQRVEMTSVTVSCWYVCHGKKKQKRNTACRNIKPLLFLQALYYKGQSRSRTDERFVSTLKYLYSTCGVIKELWLQYLLLIYSWSFNLIQSLWDLENRHLHSLPPSYNPRFSFLALT